MSVSGNWTLNGTWTHNNGTVTCNGTGAQTLTGAYTFYNLTVNNTAGTPSDTVDVESSAATTVTNTLNVNDGQFSPVTASSFKDVTIGTNGVLKPLASASITVSGNFTRTGTFTHNNGTVTFNASVAQTITGTVTFYNLTIDNTAGSPSDTIDVEPSSATTVSNTLTVTDGQFSPPTGSTFTAVSIGAAGILKPVASATISVTTSWTNVGTFTANSGTVSLTTTTTATIAGATTFNNLSCTVANKQINFTAGTTQTISGTLTLTGTAGNLILLRSTSGGSTYTITDNGTESVSYVNVQDSVATNSINTSNSTNSGNNTNWFFYNPGQWIGSIDTNWATAGNWGDSNVPNGIAVTIDTAANQPTVSSAVSNITSLTILPNSTLTFASGGSLQTSGAISVSGTLVLDDNSTLTIGGNQNITVNSGGALNVTGSDSSAAATAGTIQSTTSGTTYWQLVVANGGSVDARGARFIDGVINPSSTAPTELRLTDVFFSALPSGVGNAFIDLQTVDTGAIAFKDLTFNRGSAVAVTSAVNILADANTKEIWVGGYGGDIGGETFDVDASNNIHWVNNAAPIKRDDGAVTYVESLDEALEGLGAGTLKIYANYTDGSGDLVSGFSTVGGALVLPDFSGTLELDGFTFRTVSAASGTVLDTTAIVSGGTVKLYNCMLLDPYDNTGTGRALITATGTVTADFCTVDADSAATAGIDTEDDCLFTRPITAANYVDSSGRNYHLTLTGNSSIGNGDGALVSGHERDVDGVVRPDSTNSDLGADYYGSDGTAASIISLTDVTGGLATTPSMVIVEGGSVLGSGSGAHFVASYDESNCYLSAINRTDITVYDSLSWTGYRCVTPTVVQCTSPDTNKFWVYVGYDSDSDGNCDTIRRCLYNTTTTSFESSATVGDVSGNLANATNSDTDITLNSGWKGSIAYVSPFISGTAEHQAAIITEDGGGEVHTFFINNAAANGNFYRETTFTTAARAAESFTSGTTTVNANSYAQIILTGGSGSGTMYLTRTNNGAGANAAGLLLVSRATDGGDITGLVTNTLTGPASGASFSATPGLVSNFSSQLMSSYNGESKIAMYTSDTLVAQTIDLGLSGYGAPDGVDSKAVYQSRTTLVPFYNASTGKGAVAAVEYAYDQNGGSTYEVLNGSYSDNKLYYTGSGGANDFDAGVAHITGKPTSLLYLFTKQTAWCGTSAGLLYAWDVAGNVTGEDTVAKGTLRANYPISVPSGEITQLANHQLTDATKKTALGLGAGTQFVVTVYTSTGQLILVRHPS